MNALTQFSLAPQTLDEAMRYAEMIADTEMVPKDFRGKAGNVLVAVQMGAELGLPPMQSLQNIAVINGRPAIWGDALLALVSGRSDCEDVVEECTDREAKCTIKRRGKSPVTRTFSMDDAQKAGLAGKQGPWTQYPKRMLQMRARSWAIRDCYPDALKGISIAEEAQDIPTERDVTPPRQEESQSALPPPYPQDQFEANSPKWIEAIKAGKSAHDLISMVQSKGTLTETQKNMLYAAELPDDAKTEETVA